MTNSDVSQSRDTGAGEDQPTETATDPSLPETPVARRGVPTWVAAVLAVLLIVALTAAIVLWHRDQTQQGKAADTQAVATTAGGLGKALLSYDSTDLAGSHSRVLALATAGFAKTYSQDFTNSLGGTITVLKATSTATVRDVYVSDVSGDKAKAIVVVDFQTKSTAGTRNVLGTNLQMDLIDQAGHWKVNSVTVISATSESQTPAAG